MSYIKIDYLKSYNLGIYLLVKNYAGDAVSEFKFTNEYKLFLRIKVKGKVAKNIFIFPKDKIFKKIIKTVSDCRIDLKKLYEEIVSVKIKPVVAQVKKLFKGYVKRSI